MNRLLCLGQSYFHQTYDDDMTTMMMMMWHHFDVHFLTSNTRMGLSMWAIVLGVMEDEK